MLTIPAAWPTVPSSRYLSVHLSPHLSCRPSFFRVCVSCLRGFKPRSPVRSQQTYTELPSHAGRSLGATGHRGVHEFSVSRGGGWGGAGGQARPSTRGAAVGAESRGCRCRGSGAQGGLSAEGELDGRRGVTGNYTGEERG